MLVKLYGPAEFSGIKMTAVANSPDEAHVSTSYVEPQNLMMRMKRSIRLSNAFSKKFEYHEHLAPLYTVWYNS